MTPKELREMFEEVEEPRNLDFVCGLTLCLEEMDELANKLRELTFDIFNLQELRDFQEFVTISLELLEAMPDGVDRYHHSAIIRHHVLEDYRMITAALAKADSVPEYQTQQITDGLLECKINVLTHTDGSRYISTMIH